MLQWSWRSNPKPGQPASRHSSLTSRRGSAGVPTHQTWCLSRGVAAA
jgi:hypothetical protein